MLSLNSRMSGILTARCALYITYSLRFEKNDILRQYNDKFIYTLSRSAQNHRPPNNVRPAEGYIRISHNLLTSRPLIPQRLFYSFHVEPKHRKKK